MKTLDDEMLALVGQEIQACIPDDVTGISSYTGTLMEVCRNHGGEGWAHPWLKIDTDGYVHWVNTAFLLSVHTVRPRI